ncbi:MAG: M20 family metallopeptidase [Acidimicrobiales bacterium]|jgi:hippurate hydrolase
MDILLGLYDEARGHLNAAVAIRREIHAHPEVGLDLPVTQAVVMRELEGLGLELHTGKSLSSVTAILDTGREGPTVLLRGDMDALRLQEDTGLEFASKIDGVMHACCHDSHVAMLIEAAKLLKAREHDVRGKVIFMFQPGEEMYFGAKLMIDEGLLSYTESVDVAFAIHASPLLPSGSIMTKSGAFMASADEIFINVQGHGGHASMPHTALDPIPVACEIVSNLQTMITRKIPAFDPAVLTIAHITAGTTTNVIPDTASMEGTLRSVSQQTRELVAKEAVRVAEGIGAAHGLDVTARVEFGYPVTVNDHDVSVWVSDIAADLFGQEQVIESPSPIMGAEDFSYVLNEVPGAMVFLGACPDGFGAWQAPGNHSNLMVMKEECMSAGIALYAGVVLAKSSEFVAT